MHLSRLHPVSNGINHTWYAYAEGIGYGYLKNCAATERAMEELEVWMAFFAGRFGVKMAETWLVQDESGGKLGCFSLDAAGENGVYMTAGEIKNRWLVRLEPIPGWAVEAAEIFGSAPAISLSPDRRLIVVSDVSVMVRLLSFLYGVLSFGGRHEVSAGFVDMALLDCLVGQKDRNMNGFGLVVSPDGTAEAAALYDNATILMPGVDASMVGFCNILCTPALLAQAVTLRFPLQARDFARRFRDLWQAEGTELLLRQQDFLAAPYHAQMVKSIDRWLRFSCRQS